MRAAVLLLAALPQPTIVPVDVPGTATQLPPYTATSDGILITEGDIADRPYDEIGPIVIKKGGGTLLTGNPTRDTMTVRLAAKAKAMSADAVVRVRFKTTGMSLTSFYGMRVEGVAVRYRQR